MPTFNDFTELPGVLPIKNVQHIRTENMPTGRESIGTMNPDIRYRLDIIRHQGGYAVIATDLTKGSTKEPFFIDEGQFATQKQADIYGRGAKIGKPWEIGLGFLEY